MSTWVASVSSSVKWSNVSTFRGNRGELESLLFKGLSIF